MGKWVSAPWLGDGEDGRLGPVEERVDRVAIESKPLTAYQIREIAQHRANGAVITIVGDDVSAQYPNGAGTVVPEQPYSNDHVGVELAKEQLAQWWRDTAESEIGMVVAKAIEYGSRDLVDIGREMHESGVKLPGNLLDAHERDAYYASLGIFYYIVGKLSRWKSAVSEGRVVSLDTIVDIGVYTRMALRVRTAGSWPGVDVTASDGLS